MGLVRRRAASAGAAGAGNIPLLNYNLPKGERL